VKQKERKGKIVKQTETAKETAEERESESWRERDEKGKMEKVCKCNLLPRAGATIPPTKVNFHELLI
jgi:hypothetical protein